MPTPLKILLIEDDPDDIDFLQSSFSDNGYRVNLEVLNRGDLINKYLQSNPAIPDLIVMDLNLPKLHGREVLCLIRKDKRFDNVRIAVVTTSSLEEDKNYCMKNGADRFFSKPSSPEGFAKLAAALQEIAVYGNKKSLRG